MPLGMRANDPLLVDFRRIGSRTLVGEVITEERHTPLLHAAKERGCTLQVGTDMLCKTIPAHLGLFAFDASLPNRLDSSADEYPPNPACGSTRCRGPGWQVCSAEQPNRATGNKPAEIGNKRLAALHDQLSLA